jgi:hypothetical protein
MKVNTTSFDFSSLDLSGTKPISIPMETVEVSISSTDMIDSYAKAFCAEARRKNPLRAEQVNLTDDEVTQYADYLITKRVECVHNECQDARKLKVLYIPSYLQFVLETIGIYQDRTYGLKLVPIMEEKSEMTFEEALKVSEKIGSFIDDLQIVQDAMPRENVGHEGVMATALIAGYMRSYKTSVKPVDTYVAAFLKLQLVKEQSFAALYRIQYDDYDFIQAALTSYKGLF